MMSSSAARIALICLTTLFAIAVGAMTEDEDRKKDECYDTGSCCIRDCKGREDGDYQSCRGCSIYAACTNGSLKDKQHCRKNDPPLQWDDYSKQCKYTSRTCKCHPNLVKVSDIFAMNRESKEKETILEKLIWARIWKKH